MMFWQLWLYQIAEDWTLLEFIVLLMGPIVMLIAASLLVPARPVADYRSYFESMRKPFYSVLIVMTLQPNILPYLQFDLPLRNPLILSSAVFSTAAFVGLVARKSAVDAALVCCWILGVVGGALLQNDHAETRALFESLSGRAMSP